MNKNFYVLSSLFLLLLHGFSAQAQYMTPVLDGNIGAGEYGPNSTAVTTFGSTENNNQNSFTTSDGGNWYMSWNAQNLYVGKTNGDSGEPTIMYLDLDPILPVTGGDDTNGNIMGTADNGTTPFLPFRADVRVYVIGNYVEIRRRTGDGKWSDAITNDLSLATNPSGSTREISLSWATLTGGGSIPPTFNWLGYALSPGGYRYHLAPANSDAEATNRSNTPIFQYYNTVVSTADGAATKPFALRSYTFPTALSNYGGSPHFYNINVWDYTLNSTNTTVTRSDGQFGGNWLIGGSLVVGAGTLDFGSITSTTNVGNLRVTGGLLDMNLTNQNLNVVQDVVLSGGQLQLASGQYGGDLYVGRDFLIQNRTNDLATRFNPNKRAVFFLGGTGTSHVVQAPTNFTIPFAYLAVANGNNVMLSNNISVSREIDFNSGNIITGDNTIFLSSGASLQNESATSHIIGQVQITQSVAGSGSGLQSFGNLGFSLNPSTGAAALGSVTVTRTTGTTLLGVGMGNKGQSIQRYFTLSGISGGTALANETLTYGYRPDELNNILENNLALYQSLTGTPPYAKVTPTTTDTGGHTLTYTGSLTITNGTVITLSDGNTPLPVTLVSFTATATAQGTALLRWLTASETNNRGFNIERQLDGGSSWATVGFVAAGAATGSTYEYLDKSLASAPASDKAYYRLRQEDLNGQTSYSPVAVINRAAGVAATELTLSPVPVSTSLSLAMAEAGQAGIEVAIINTQGQRLVNFTTEASTDAALSLPVANLAAGVYIVSVQVPGQAVRHARFVKL
ncbi:T9SS type A sorting domain-containing protein [Hymenobacter psoromatis]|uniref:T9SS type A sorting domain-containing protein n=1 Tax=Hymenobacter psoromatis TaxID=1484116 RepID=UPI001CBDDB19|nr:T9SS type A sorting domain-containing protein [Hymenobacter psoromatis]